MLGWSVEVLRKAKKSLTAPVQCGRALCLVGQSLLGELRGRQYSGRETRFVGEVKGRVNKPELIVEQSFQQGIRGRGQASLAMISLTLRIVYCKRSAVDDVVGGLGASQMLGAGDFSGGGTRVRTQSPFTCPSLAVPTSLIGCEQFEAV